MIKISGSVPMRNFYLALSGGVDSMAVMDFLRKGKREFTAAYFNHGTENGANAEKFVKEYCEKIGQKLIIGRINRDKLQSESQEEYWRNVRYHFFNCLGTVITCHHLDDCIETWIFTSLHGDPKLIPYRNNNVIRPFLMTKKQDFVSWCERNKVPWLDDPSNFDPRHARNRIRHLIVPQALIINPGIAKVIRKKLKARKEQE